MCLKWNYAKEDYSSVDNISWLKPTGSQVSVFPEVLQTLDFLQMAKNNMQHVNLRKKI